MPTHIIFCDTNNNLYLSITHREPLQKQTGIIKEACRRLQGPLPPPLSAGVCILPAPNLRTSFMDDP